jgi:hypothetical protein
MSKKNLHHPERRRPAPHHGRRGVSKSRATKVVETEPIGRTHLSQKVTRLGQAPGHPQGRPVAKVFGQITNIAVMEGDK